MTIEELQHIFRFQLTEDENYTPTNKVDYMLFIGQARDRIFHDVDKLELLLTSLKDFESGKKQYNASAQAAVDLGDTVKRIDGSEVPILTPWLKGRATA